MKLDEAKAECERWLARCDRQREKSLSLQVLARDRREGRCDADEARRRMQEIDRAGVQVYDGANLETAIRTLLRHCGEKI